MKSRFKLICDCGSEEFETDIGVNDSIYYECLECGKTFNIIEGHIDKN